MVISILLLLLPICFSLSLARQTSNSISRLSLDPCSLLPNEYMLMHWCVCLSPPSLPLLQALPNPSLLTIPHFPTSVPRIYLTSISPSLSVWMVVWPARRLSHGVESQHLVAGSDQSTPLEAHQHPRTHTQAHTHKRVHARTPTLTQTPQPPNSRGTVGSEREGEMESEGESRERKGWDYWMGVVQLLR